MVMIKQDPRKWAEQEFGNANLGNIRRTKRLVKIAAAMGDEPDRVLSGSCEKGSASLVSRFLGRPEVTLDSLLEPHIEQTKLRCAKYERVYAIQDTTSLNYASHEALEGLGHMTSSAKGGRHTSSQSFGCQS